ncbi:hypothetical protein BGZ63DRAFT_422218 [Mariannaea sp. PMI_226]|nr:hypothetical protein BGZ63DRAFT_422218 [Mariannaea sp. PMI_226]
MHASAVLLSIASLMPGLAIAKGGGPQTVTVTVISTVTAPLSIPTSGTTVRNDGDKVMWVQGTRDSGSSYVEPGNFIVVTCGWLFAWADGVDGRAFGFDLGTPELHYKDGVLTDPSGNPIN